MTYYIYIDDSGNINLTDKNNLYFVYSALVFESIIETQKFALNYEKIIKNIFGTKKEIKSSQQMSKNKRQKIFDFININCLYKYYVVAEKNLCNNLSKIEDNFNLQISNNTPIIDAKKYRKKQYGIQKSYLIGKLLETIIKDNRLVKNSTFYIYCDYDNFYFKSSKEWTNYLNNQQPYLKSKKLNNYYNFFICDSKKYFGIQAADFYANSVFKFYEKNAKSCLINSTNLYYKHPFKTW